MSDGSSSTGLKVAIVFAVLLGGFLLFRTFSGSSDPYSVDRLTEDVTIRCDETGKEWELNRGMMERMLRTRDNGADGLIDPSVGFVNSETGQPTGFPVNRDKDWEQTIERINEEKRAAAARGGRRG